MSGHASYDASSPARIVPLKDVGSPGEVKPVNEREVGDQRYESEQRPAVLG